MQLCVCVTDSKQFSFQGCEFIAKEGSKEGSIFCYAKAPTQTDVEGHLFYLFFFFMASRFLNVLLT